MATNADAHRETTRREFARQAEDFESSSWVFTDADVLDWIAAAVPLRPSDRVLDVAGGTGALGRHLGLRAASCVVLDLVPEMLAAGAAAARAAGRLDVLYVEGDATRMPFAAAQFDVVVTRFALHHIDAPAQALAEIVRVAEPGARVAVIDVIAAEGDAGDELNRLERLRDPSHATALRRSELLALLQSAGVAVDHESEREQTMSATRWLERAHGPQEGRAEVAAALAAEAAGGPATGLRAAERGGELTIVQTWLLATGRTPA